MAGVISSLGVGSGLQLRDILDQLRTVDEQTITIKEAKVTALATKLDEFDVVKNKLIAMKSFALDLSLSSNFLARTITSSNEEAVTATVMDGASTQSYSVTVNRLASRSSWQSAGKAAEDASVAAADDLFKYEVDGEEYTVEVESGTTLSELAALINDDESNPGVTAQVIDDGDPDNPYRLVLQADDTGEDNRISITMQLDALALAEVNGAGGGSLNAEIEVNGITYQRQTNSSISDVISGVTLNFHQEGSSSSIVVASNDTAAIDMITGLVEAYNDAVQEIQANVAYDEETEAFGVLADTTIRDLAFDLQNLMTQTVQADADGDITSMFDLGMTFNQDGTISIDGEVLAAAVANNPEGVQAFFLGDEDEEITGFADLVNDQLRTITGSTGQVEAEKTMAQARIDDLELQIEAETERLDKRYELLTKQFVELDRYMNQMTSMSDYLSGQFESYSSMWSGSSK